MRLLFVQDSLGTGGAERSNAELWYFLEKQKDISIKVVVLEHRKEGIENEVLSKGFDVTFLKEVSFIEQTRQIIRIIKDFKPDIVHSVLFRSAIRVRLAHMTTKFYHIESLVNCSYSEVRYKDPKISSTGLTLYKYLNRFTQGKGTDLFIAITNEVKNHAIRHLNIKEDKIKVIPRGRKENPYLGQKSELRNKLISELHLEQDAVIFIHVGRQEYQKGHIDLLKAINEKREELKKINAHFVFCGRKGNATNELDNYVIDNELSDYMHWLGHRNDIAKLLVASDVFIFPSLFEGLGGALIEAQAAGLPVICSNIKVFDEVVNPGENALQFEVGNPKDLADKLLMLGNDKERRNEMSSQSLINFKKNFNIDDIHKRMLTLEQKIIS